MYKKTQTNKFSKLFPYLCCVQTSCVVLFGGFDRSIFCLMEPKKEFLDLFFYFRINSYLNCLPSLQTNLIFRFLDFVATQTPSSPAASFSTPSTADALTHLAILKGRRDLKEIHLSHFKQC
jgi:hypothetical protein